MNARHFTSAGEFRAWLTQHHETAPELSVGFHQRRAGRAGLTYAEALDEALCFGWIDGLRRRIDDDSYSIRFTARRSGSIWSRVNVRHAQRLITEGRMQAAGLKAFAAREDKRTGIYSFEQHPQTLPAALAKVFRANPEAWTHWRQQPAGYRRTFGSALEVTGSRL
jgi:uncharacterized protein YdeI (YjbR/CyaY-like superfamily)